MQLGEMAGQIRKALGSGSTFDALRFAESLVGRFPHDAQARYLFGRAQLSVARYEEALQSFRDCVELGGFEDAEVRVRDLSSAIERNENDAGSGQLRSWNSGLPLETLKSIQKGLHNFTYRGVRIQKNPFDFALYQMLIWELRPGSIIEIGSKEGGSAIWMADLCELFGFGTRVISIDVVKARGVSHDRVTFLEGDGRNLSPTLSSEFLSALPRPWLVIEDADHTYATSNATLNFFDPHFTARDFFIVEDGVISDLSGLGECGSGPHRALREFLGKNFMTWEIADRWCDFFGCNFTWNTNGFLRKPGHDPLERVEILGLPDIRVEARNGNWAGALARLRECDYVRDGSVASANFLLAFCLMQSGEIKGAWEAINREVELFPANEVGVAFRSHLLLYFGPELAGA